jgi:hypothetical protein
MRRLDRRVLIDFVVNRGPFYVRQKLLAPRMKVKVVMTACNPTTGHASKGVAARMTTISVNDHHDDRRRQHFVDVVVIVRGQCKLLQIVAALAPACRLAGRLDGR